MQAMIKHFIVIWTDGKDSGMNAFDTMSEVEDFMEDAEHGADMNAQCYEWNSREGWYEFLYEE